MSNKFKQWCMVQPQEFARFERGEIYYYAFVPSRVDQLAAWPRGLNWWLASNQPPPADLTGYVRCYVRDGALIPLGYCYPQTGADDLTADGTQVVRRHVRFAGGAHDVL